MTDRPTWPVVAATLVLGFVVAQATGVRPLGGLVLLVGAGWCALRWRERSGTPTAVVLLAVFLAAFALSHVIAALVSTWPAVFLAAGAAAAAAFFLSDAPRAGARRGLRATMGT